MTKVVDLETTLNQYHEEVAGNFVALENKLASKQVAWRLEEALRQELADQIDKEMIVLLLCFTQLLTSPFKLQKAEPAKKPHTGPPFKDLQFRPSEPPQDIGPWFDDLGFWFLHNNP